ncbi:hypothetical protein HK101_011298 [Irineochytrium annulatum]|nr:hypothetical protein HK101_011298 [Irineochytrium annulatum]
MASVDKISIRIRAGDVNNRNSMNDLALSAYQEAESLISSAVRESNSITAVDMCENKSSSGYEEYSSVIDRLNEAERKLTLPSPSAENLEKAELHKVLAKLNLRKVQKNMAGEPLMEMFSDTVDCNSGGSVTLSWVAVSLSIEGPAGDMYITRVEMGESPVVVRLPLKRMALREGLDDGTGFEECVSELNAIIVESNLSVKRTKGESSNMSKSERKAWWTQRKALDSRLQAWLDTVEQSWLGGFKGLFLLDDFSNEKYKDIFSDFKRTVETALVDVISAKVRVKTVPLHPSLCRMILRLGSDPDPLDVEDLLYYLMDAYQYAGCPVGYDEINIDSKWSLAML